MVYLKPFLTRRNIVILFTAACSALVVTAIIIGLVLGLRRNDPGEQTQPTKYSTSSQQTQYPGYSTTTEPREEVCGSAHETYVINGSSILGKYKRAAVAVDNEECSKIGKDILELNGSTMDAAIAAAICNGVLNGHSMGIGGGCLITVYIKSENKSYSLIGREKAPAAANSTMFVGRPGLSTTGGLAIGVPGELRTYQFAYQKFGGKVPWKALFEPTIRLCREGFIVSTSQAAAIRQTRDRILDDPVMKAVFFNNATNDVYVAGERMKRLQLADTLEIIANESADAFYNGSLTDQIVEEIREQGGIITRQDLENYHLAFNDSISIDIGDAFTAYTTHAPSSGPILTFILNLMQGYKFNASDLNNTNTAGLFYHRLIESFKFAYAKRSELGDPEKINITDLIRNLTSEDYADSIRAKINDQQTFGFQYYGGTWFDQVKTGTAHLSLVGPNGDAVALSSTINLYFGSKVMGRLTGIIYNDEMDDFSTPNTTNAFGVPASPANYIQPGKRPVSSMAPLIVVEKSTGRVQQVLGASGGTRITTSIAQVSMLNLLFNENIKEAIDSPRLHSQLLPEEVIAEEGFDRDVLLRLRQRGHKITCGAFGGSVIQGIEWRDEVNEYWANCDIRKGGAPAGLD